MHDPSRFPILAYGILIFLPLPQFSLTSSLLLYSITIHLSDVTHKLKTRTTFHVLTYSSKVREIHGTHQNYPRSISTF